MEPAKNLLRGFWAFDEMLRMRPSLVGEVVMLALAYPSRQTLPEYLAYAAEVEQAVRRVNDTWATDDWAPVILDVADDPGRSAAALVRYDVLLVNSVRDGLNLVAKEGPLLNTANGVLALSREAGAFAELHGAALEVNPFDVSGTAAVLLEALEMAPAERARRGEDLRERATRRKPGEWLADQLTAALGASASEKYPQQRQRLGRPPHHHVGGGGERGRRFCVRHRHAHGARAGGGEAVQGARRRRGRRRRPR